MASTLFSRLVKVFAKGSARQQPQQGRARLGLETLEDRLALSAAVHPTAFLSSGPVVKPALTNAIGPGSSAAQTGQGGGAGGAQQGPSYPMGFSLQDATSSTPAAALSGTTTTTINATHGKTFKILV